MVDTELGPNKREIIVATGPEACGVGNRLGNEAPQKGRKLELITTTSGAGLTG